MLLRTDQSSLNFGNSCCPVAT